MLTFIIATLEWGGTISKWSFVQNLTDMNTPGGRLHTILPQVCGLKSEGNGSFLDLEGGKRCPAIWRVYTCMGVFIES